MDKANSLPTPMVSSLQLSKEKGEPNENEKQYISILGALQYVTITRPDITYRVNKVSHYMNKSLSDHQIAIKRILRYLKGTNNLGLNMRASKVLNLTCYADSNWTNDIDKRRSTSRHYVFLGKKILFYGVKKNNQRYLGQILKMNTEA